MHKSKGRKYFLGSRRRQDEGREVKQPVKVSTSRRDESRARLGGTSGEQTSGAAGGGTVNRGALSHQTHPLFIE